MQNVQRLVKRYGKTCEVGESDHELLLDLTVRTVTFYVSGEDQGEN